MVRTSRSIKRLISGQSRVTGYTRSTLPFVPSRPHAAISSQVIYLSRRVHAFRTVSSILPFQLVYFSQLPRPSLNPFIPQFPPPSTARQPSLSRDRNPSASLCHFSRIRACNLRYSYTIPRLLEIRRNERKGKKTAEERRTG